MLLPQWVTAWQFLNTHSLVVEPVVTTDYCIPPKYAICNTTSTSSASLQQEAEDAAAVSNGRACQMCSLAEDNGYWSHGDWFGKWCPRSLCKSGASPTSRRSIVAASSLPHDMDGV